MALQAASLYANVSVAGVGQSVRDLGAVSAAADRAQGHLTILGKRSQGIGKGFGQLGQGVWNAAKFAAAGAAILGGAGVAAAISFEDAWANVRKTVEGTPKQLDTLNQALKALSTRIPVSYQDLTAIATEAGALNVAADDVDNFTEAVARTTAATVGLDTALASEAFGKIGTIFDLHGKDYERFGSVLVELGRNGASTEADIIAVTQRFAAAGQQAGLSADQVLGWSSALASLGPEAEAAGGALQRTFNRVTQNIALMNEKNIKGKNAKKRVEAFARVSGMTVDEFVAAYTADASAAMEGFIGGLADSDRFTVAREFVKAGIVNQRDLYALSSFANRQEVLTSQLRLSNKAWAENTALTEVSTSRFDTLKAKLTELWNTAKLGANAFGHELLPALGRVSLKAKDLILANMDDFRTWGREAGKAIDSIDWTRVQSALSSMAGVAKTVLGTIRDLVGQFPELTAALVGLYGLNKVSGGMLGKGGGNIVGGVGELIYNRFLERGSSPANPVWVAGIGGSGIPGAGAAAGLGAAATAGIVTAAAAGSAYAFSQTYSGPKAMGAYTPTVGSAFSPSPLADAFSQVDWTKVAGYTGYPNAVTTGGSPDHLGKAKDDLIGPARHAGKALDDLAIATTMTARTLASRVGVWASFGDSAKTALAGIAARGKTAVGSDRSSSQVMGTFGRNLMRNEAKILASSNSTVAKLGDLKRLHRIAIDGKDWGTARKIQKSIDNLKARMKAESDQTQVKQAQTTKAAQAAAFAIEHKDFHAEVDVYPSVSHFTIDGRQIAHSVQKWLPGVRRG